MLNSHFLLIVFDSVKVTTFMNVINPLDICFIPMTLNSFYWSVVFYNQIGQNIFYQRRADLSRDRFAFTNVLELDLKFPLLMLVRVVHLVGVCSGCVCLPDQAGGSVSRQQL